MKKVVTFPSTKYKVSLIGTLSMAAVRGRPGKRKLSKPPSCYAQGDNTKGYPTLAQYNHAPTKIIPQQILTCLYSQGVQSLRNNSPASHSCTVCK